MTLALFGITNDTLNLVVNLLILFLVVLWLALVAWTYFDARRRIADPVLVASATAASLFPFVGSIVYSILRPPEFLADKKERELEVRASELRVRQLEEASCPNCEHPIERSFLRCPNCRARIKDPCESCGKPIDPRWSICPYCETPQRPAAPPEPRTSSKRRGSKPPPRETAESSRRGASDSSRSPSRSSAGSRSSSRTSRSTGAAPDSEPQRQAAPSRSSRPTRASAESRQASPDARPSGSTPPPDTKE